MNPVDPMSYKPALTAAYNALQRTNARIKHIILLGDGDAEDSYSALVTRIHKAGITISTVATGGGSYGFGADYGTMQNIARWGGGRYYQADNVNSIPQIFLKETKQIARTGIVEGRFLPEKVSDSPIIKDVPGVPLDGYVATTPKPAGLVVLSHVTKHGLDPVLAQWQYGLGRAVAWTSDAQGRWSANLIARGQGNRLWANMVSWVLPPAAPGQYEADVPAAREGAYLVGISALVHGHVRASLRTGLVVPYAAEYRTTGLDAHVLRSLAAIGTGTLLRAPAQSFADNMPGMYAPRPLTTPLLLLALLLLPFDIAVRRLLIGPAEVRAALAALARRRALQPAAAAVGAAGVPLTAIRARRATRRERIAERNAQSTSPAPQASPAPSPAPASRQEPTPMPAAQHRGGTSSPAAASPAPAAEPGATTSRLLEAKRKRRGGG